MNREDLLLRVRSEFATRFAREPDHVIWSPGRVNLIGEHTDYNEGFVLPMAIDRGIVLAMTPGSGDRVEIASLDFQTEAAFDCEALALSREAFPREWHDYAAGVAWALQDAGHQLTGWQGVVAGDLPIGAGLSSSAALEMAIARAFSISSNLPWDPLAMAWIGQQAENEWIGVNCGIMDQLACAAGQEGHALLIDCRSLEIERVPLPTDCAVIVLDSSTRRGLVESAYNERRQQCEAAAQHFGMHSLRDLDLREFAQQRNELSPVVAKRAHHVITENERTRQAAAAMVRDSPRRLGRLMNESHASLRDDFEVSTPTLDELVAIAQAHPGCFGARMTGAGFGGCAVALVRTATIDAFTTGVCTDYRMATGHTAQAYACRASAGTGAL